MVSGTDLTVWIAFIAGIMSFFSPCVLPLIPSYLTYISGLSYSELKNDKTALSRRLVVFQHSLLFVAGFSLVFISLGALAGLASVSFQYYLRDALGVVQKVGGVLIFLFGIHLSGLYRFRFLLTEKQLHLRNRPAGMLGTLFIGIVFAAAWTPCIGPVLGAILAVAAGHSGSVGNGTLLLVFYSAGLGVPFLLSGLLFHRLLGVFDRFKKHLRQFEIATGLLLMLTGLLLFFDLFSQIAWLLYDMFPVIPG